MNNEIVRCPRQRIAKSSTGSINMIVSEGGIAHHDCVCYKVQGGKWWQRPTVVRRQITKLMIIPSKIPQDDWSGSLLVTYLLYTSKDVSWSPHPPPQSPPRPLNASIRRRMSSAAVASMVAVENCSLALWILLLITVSPDLIASYDASEGRKAG